MVEPQTNLSVRKQCELLGISRSGLYYQPVSPSPEDLALMRRIDELHLRCPFYGSRKIGQQLRAKGHAAEILSNVVDRPSA